MIATGVVLLGLVVFIGWNIATREPVEVVVRPEATMISAVMGKAMMEDGEPFVLLDVRTEEEFDWARIPGAILIPYDELRERALSELPDKGARIILYCQTGRRTRIASEVLLELGYDHIYDMGGILGWTFEIEGDYNYSGVPDDEE